MSYRTDYDKLIKDLTSRAMCYRIDGLTIEDSANKAIDDGLFYTDDYLTVIATWMQDSEIAELITDEILSYVEDDIMVSIKECED